MKKCTYCGRENEDNATYCSGCFQDDRFEPDATTQAKALDDQDELVTLTTCARLPEADLIACRLESAGIKAFIPDQHLMQAIGFNLNTFGYVRVQVCRKDLSSAEALLAQPAAISTESQLSAPDGLKAIASLAAGQTGELLARLQKEQIPAKVRTTTQESGLEMSEILVTEEYYDRGCAVVEAWDAEQFEAQKKRSGVYCKKCGSRDYDSRWDEQVGTIYTCRKCGDEFVV
jgi:hypothetical protein